MSSPADGAAGRTPAESMRELFRERGWSIHMDGNQYAVLDPFIEAAAAAQVQADEALRLLRELNNNAFGPDWDYELSQGDHKELSDEIDAFLARLDGEPG